MKSALSLGVAALAFLPSLGHSATVTGTVKGPDGSPYRGAFVQAQNAATRIMVSVLTDKAGRYRITITDKAPAGSFTIQKIRSSAHTLTGSRFVGRHTVLLALTLFVGVITLGTGRTTVLQGMVHLVIFATFLFLSVVP